jgi:hypothetical protein
MRPIVSLVLLLIASSLTVLPSFAQHSSVTKASVGRMKVEAAYAYQAKLADSSITIEQAIGKWRLVAKDPEVRSDKDALAVALGCEGLLEIQRSELLSADSLLSTAMPLFRLRKSKAYFLIAYAGLERTLSRNIAATRAYREIIETLDSVPELDRIDFYRLSGYAPYAYGIDAAYQLGKIAESDSADRRQIIGILKAAMKRHSSNPLTLMCASALKRIDGDNEKQYDFQINLVCSRNPDYRALADKFAKRLR